MKLPFFSDCVHWPASRLETLSLLCEHGKEITKGSFLRHVELEHCNADFFGGHLRDVLKDWYTRFYSYKGVYWFEWSAIEYVFATADQLDTLAAAAEYIYSAAQDSAGDVPCPGKCPYRRNIMAE